MKFSPKIVFSFILIIVAGCRIQSQLSPSSRAQLPPSSPAYQLVFNDEFEKTFPPYPVDSKKWDRNFPWNQSSNLSDNVSWCFPGDTTSRYWDRAYTIKDLKDTSTVKVSNGTCKIFTNKVNYQGQVSNWPPCDPNRPGYGIDGNKCRDSCGVKGHGSIPSCWTTAILPFKYTTGMLFSRQKFFRGYFEIRFRLPATPETPYSHEGFDPNFWLWGNKPPENWSSEIDVFEIIAFNPHQQDSNKYTSTVHYSDKETGRKPNAHTEILGNKLKNDTAWHTAAAWWTGEFVKFYLDDSLFYTVQDNKDILVEKLVAMNIIIGIAGPTSGRCNNFDPVHTQFPYVYEVDYVRVYQEK